MHLKLSFRHKEFEELMRHPLVPKQETKKKKNTIEV